MAKDPDSRPITVEELISRTVGADTHFPRADSVAVRREEGATAAPDSATGASGMPGYTPPTTTPPRRAVGASGMPAYTPASSKRAESDDKESANVVTGIIPIVTDDDESAALIPDTQSEEFGDHLAGADELAKAQDSAQLVDAENAAEDEAAPKKERSPLLGWLGLVGEVILGLAIGAGLFWGFTVLWKEYVYLALVLAVIVIFAIVTFAYVLRKRDLPTTLLALAVGLIVTIGPLVLLV